MTDVFEHSPQVWNAAQLRDALKDLPDDAPIHIGVAERNSQDLWIKSVAVVSLTQLATGVSADAPGSSGLSEQGEGGG
ncbi:MULTISPECIES: DUF6225 family protein [unclassified Streptomyces]|uniref:DUF6225 family protein n=1 Tax=unclassified Streptomyces TaxID=2593676 RepID=UPI0037FA6AD6